MVSDKKIFMFSLYNPMYPVTPRADQPHGYNLNKHGRGPLGDTTYQIPRLWAKKTSQNSFVACVT